VPLPASVTVPVLAIKYWKVADGTLVELSQ